MSLIRDRASVVLRDRLGIPGLLAIVALVFAMVGGAWAAKGGGLTAKQKKQVETIAKKHAGKPGAPGATGPAGTPGKDGAPGQNGAPGKDGQSVTTSPASAAECPAGGTKFTSASGTSKACNGSPWVVGGVLPSNATLTGSWAFGKTTAGGEVNIPISFAIPLAAALGESQVHFLNLAGKEVIFDGAELDEEDSTKCLGTVAAPSAEPGHLCIYTGAGNDFIAASNFSIEKWSAGKGADVAGARFRVEAGGADAQGGGTWAVTAE